MNIDQYIWKSFIKGSRSSFEDLYELYFESLYLYAYQMKPDSAIIEDLIHDVFLELWNKKDKLPDVKHVKAYLMKIVRRKVFSKSKKYFDPVDSENYLLNDLAYFEEMQDEDSEVKELVLRTCLQKLTKRQKEIIHLKYFENLSASEIQEITGLSQQRIYNIVSESLKKLKLLLSKNSIILMLVLSLYWLFL